MALSPWVKDMLESSGVAYRPTRHRRAESSHSLAGLDGMSERRVAKTVVVLADGRPLLLVLPGTHLADLDKVEALAEARSARLASEEEIAGIFNDCEVGAVPPLRHWQGVEIWLDPSLRTEGEILFQGGTLRDGVRVRFWEWFRLVRPRIESFAA